MIRDEEYGLVFSYEELEILRRLDKEIKHGKSNSSHRLARHTGIK